VRLFDAAPGGDELLVTRGVYRFESEPPSGTVRFPFESPSGVKLVVPTR
jgi:hypothetical protein